MKYLKFFRKEKNKTLLYKKISNAEFLGYDENHSKEDFTRYEIDRLKKIGKQFGFGENTSTCVTIFFKTIIGPKEIFCIIEKFKDEYFMVHTAKISNDLDKKFNKLDTYLCDTLEGVIDFLIEFEKGRITHIPRFPGMME